MRSKSVTFSRISTPGIGRVWPDSKKWAPNFQRDGVLSKMVIVSSGSYLISASLCLLVVLFIQVLGKQPPIILHARSKQSTYGSARHWSQTQASGDRG